MSVSIPPLQDNYYTFVPSIYVQLGATVAVDALYDGVMFILIAWYTDDIITTICDDAMMLSVLYISIVCRCNE